MMKLLKYELLRKKKVYVVMLSIFAALTLLVAIGIPRLDNDYWMILVPAASLVLIVGGALFPFIINTAKYYGDFKNRNGFMMFLTPNSGAKIFGSKILAAIIDSLAVFILLGIFGFISYSIADATYAFAPYINTILAELQQQIPSLNLSTLIFAVSIAALIQSISTIILALFSITVSKTLLSHRSINWFIPLLIFIGLKWVEQFITTFIIAIQNFDSFKDLIANNNMTLDISLVLMIAIGVNVLFATAYTIISSALISKKLDL
jgi:hypothetical protein